MSDDDRIVKYTRAFIRFKAARLQCDIHHTCVQLLLTALDPGARKTWDGIDKLLAEPRQIPADLRDKMPSVFPAIAEIDAALKERSDANKELWDIWNVMSDTERAPFRDMYQGSGYGN
jgi:hypothetical protein